MRTQIKLTWNGEEIPACRAGARPTGLISCDPRPDYAVNAYRLHVDLKQLRRLPRTGINTVGIEVVEKDAQLIHPVTLADVGLVVEYLPHRNALRADEEYFA